ncbi:unnamed protein product [Pocillopora meandrina]|uniref:Protein kinase domain-containing protein n=1 Tax=Pocillopora meandrina TaxID=46732 RepID=A0AAU9W2N2_9CNID|nr:unnamed protein product [Pocillopora meandrina]
MSDKEFNCNFKELIPEHMEYLTILQRACPYALFYSSMASTKKALFFIRLQAKTCLIQQIIDSTLSYVHSKGYLHKDIKANTVVLERESNSAKYNPILIHFGKSTILKTKFILLFKKDLFSPRSPKRKT